MRIENKTQGKGRLPLTSDYIFKRVFAKDENNSMLKDFLEAILNTKIQKVTVKNPEIPKNLADERLGVLDLKLEIDETTIIDVEMQMKNEHNITERSTVYLSKLIAEQLKAREPYNAIKKTIAINLLKFDCFQRNSYHSIAHMKFEKSTKGEYVELGYTKEDEMVTPIIEMHFIELNKFLKKNTECKTKLEQWLWLLIGKEEKIQMAMEENEEIKKTVEVLDELSLNEEERELYEYREKALLDYISAIDYAKTEGRAEGLADGEKKAKLEDAKKMLKENIPIEIIIRVTGLRKEEIEKLKD